MAVDHLNCDDGISHAEFVEFDKRMAIQAELVSIWEALKLAEQQMTPFAWPRRQAGSNDLKKP
jgi:hypothetical protein